MASGFVCDRCGRAIFPNELTKFRLNLWGAVHSIGIVQVDENMSEPAADLCPKCAEAVSDIIKQRIITSTTNMDAWVIGDEPQHGHMAKTTQKGTTDES